MQSKTEIDLHAFSKASKYSSHTPPPCMPAEAVCAMCSPVPRGEVGQLGGVADGLGLGSPGHKFTVQSAEE